MRDAYELVGQAVRYRWSVRDGRTEFGAYRHVYPVRVEDDGRILLLNSAGDYERRVSPGEWMSMAERGLFSVAVDGHMQRVSPEMKGVAMCESTKVPRWRAMSDKHTPGPWAIWDPDTQEFPRGSRIDILGPSPVEFGELAPRIATVHREENGEANAKLIAAAPDLLEALRACLDWVEAGSDAWELADSAIAKAEGAPDA